MLAVAIAGQKKSGKTALVTLVAEALERQGKRVAVVKYSGHEVEKGNTDAFWLMRPQRAVVNVSPGETVFLWSEQLPFERIVQNLDADILLLEGSGAPASVPRILTFKEEGEDDPTCPLDGACLTVIATLGFGAPSMGVPHFPEVDPMAAEKLVGLILEKGLVV